MKPGTGTALVTHLGCLDGTGSALMFLWAGGRRDRILFRTPTNLVLSQEDLPSDVTEVWYADCCPPDMVDPAAGRPFRVFDHHVSNMREFGHDDRCVFDMSKSGTSLMASVLGCVDDSEVPWMKARLRLIEALEAYDLGRFDHAGGQRLADAAASYSQDALLDLMFDVGSMEVLDNHEISARARAMAAVRNLYAESASRTAFYSKTDFESVGSLRIGVSSSPVYWKNEVSERILDSGKADLAVIVDPTGGMVSLRSRAGGPDCSQIAGLYGGGGHARAAGFRMRNPQYLLELLSMQVFG